MEMEEQHHTQLARREMEEQREIVLVLQKTAQTQAANIEGLMAQVANQAADIAFLRQKSLDQDAVIAELSTAKGAQAAEISRLNAEIGKLNRDARSVQDLEAYLVKLNEQLASVAKRQEEFERGTSEAHTKEIAELRLEVARRDETLLATERRVAENERRVNESDRRLQESERKLEESSRKLLLESQASTCRGTGEDKDALVGETTPPSAPQHAQALARPCMVVSQSKEDVNEKPSAAPAQNAQAVGRITPEQRVTAAIPQVLAYPTAPRVYQTATAPMSCVSVGTPYAITSRPIVHRMTQSRPVLRTATPAGGVGHVLLTATNQTASLSRIPHPVSSPILL